MLGCGLGDVRHFLVTHVHRDHYTQAVELRRIFGSKVSLGAGEHEAIRAILAGGARPFEPQIRQLQASGADVVLERLRELGAAPRGRPPGWEEPDEWLLPHQEIELDARTLRVVPTPGHTQGHVVFTDAGAGLLFAGDHVLPHITPSIGFEPVSARQSLDVSMAPDFRLTGYSVVRVGARPALNLFWQPLQASGPYDLYVHLLDASGKQMAQADVLAWPIDEGPPREDLLLTQHLFDVSSGSYTAEMGAVHRSRTDRAQLIGPPIGTVRIPVTIP